MPSHDSSATDKGGTEKETTVLIPFDIVYSRQGTLRKKEPSNPLHCPESVNPEGNVQLTLSSSSKSSNPAPQIDLNSKSDDSNLPIAVRKGVRSCTQHLLSNYVSYENLSPVFCAFTSQLSYMEIPIMNRMLWKFLSGRMLFLRRWKLLKRMGHES